MHYNNGTSKIIPYSTTYKTSINGVAQWWDIIDMYEDGNDSGLPYANNLQRYNDGVFNDIFEIKIDDYNIETLADDKNTTTNQTENTQNNKTKQTITNIDNLTNQKSNITSNSTNTNINTTQNNYNNTSTTNITQSNKKYTIMEIIKTANPLIVLMFTCILIPMGIYKKRK